MNNVQQGFVGLYFALMVVFVLSGLGVSTFLVTSAQQRIIQNTKESLQAYYGAEAGVEDALLRAKSSLIWSNPGTLGVLGAQVTTTVTDVGSIKTIVAEGNDSSRIRKAQAVYQLSGTTPQFFYGAHAGTGGLQMDNNSQIVGNVFSNADIAGDPGATVTDTATVAGSGGALADVSVQGNAFADSCSDAGITGTLHANTNNACSFGTLVSLGTSPLQVPLPITSSEIQAWKNAAEAGGTISGNYELGGSDTASLGPQKIVGNLEVSNSAVLTLTGNLWVTGNVKVQNSGRVRLDASFGAASGVIVADGIITLQNNSVSEGSGTQGSYLMYLSTNTGNPAVDAKNNIIADILYASAGWIVVENNLELHEVTGYGVHVKNNSIITYESGLTSTTFSSGPGASWELVSWKEVE